jgi:hypothetical protein
LQVELYTSITVLFLCGFAYILLLLYAEGLQTRALADLEHDRRLKSAETTCGLEEMRLRSGWLLFRRIVRRWGPGFQPQYESPTSGGRE